MKRNIVIVIIGLLMLTAIGCELMQTPEGGTVLAPNEKMDDAINKGGDVADTVGPPTAAILGAINPLWGSIATGVLTLAGSLLATYQTWRKPLVKIKAGARATADAIDKHVKNPKLPAWEDMKPDLEKAEKLGAIMPDKVS